MSALLHRGKSSTFGGLGVKCIQPSLNISVCCVFPSPALSPLVLSKFLAEHVTGQFRLLILVVPCWMAGLWLPTVLNMLEDIPQCCTVTKDLIMDVSVGQVLKGQPYLHLNVWLLRYMCYIYKGSLSQSVRQW